MEKFKAFEMEVLEERLEFGDGFFAWLWDAVCWVGESLWDMIQSLFAKATPGIGINPEGKLSLSLTAPGYFPELWSNWEETWNQYWGPDNTPQPSNFPD